MSATASESRRGSFARVGVLMFVANTLAGVFVYGVQILMGRMLAVQDYGLFAALIGVFNMTAVPLTALLMVVTRGIAHELGTGNEEAAAAIRRQAIRELALGAAVAVVVALALSGVLAGVLGSASVWPVVLLWVAVAVNVFAALGGAILQGAQRFPALAAVNVGTAALRLASCVALVAVGLGVGGSMAGVLVSVVVGGTVAWVLVYKGLPRSAGDGRKRRLFASRDAVALAVSNLAFVAMTQLDYVLVRVFCTAEQSSLYSAGAVLAKSVLWLPVGIVIALFPMVAAHAARRRSSRYLLFQSLGMALVTSGALAAILAIGAGVWMEVLYGPQFAGAAVYLRWLSLIYLPMALVLVVDNYFLALHRARFIPLYFAAVAAEVLVFVVPGGTPERLVVVLGVASLVCLAWAVWIVVRQRDVLQGEQFDEDAMVDRGQ